MTSYVLWASHATSLNFNYLQFNRFDLDKGFLTFLYVLDSFRSLLKHMDPSKKMRLNV